jgi:uncharacterized protein YjbI with pentapeptide repeats
MKTKEETLEIINKLGFKDVNLEGADLHEANLTEADLRETRLAPYILAEADLHEANLTGADLRGIKGEVTHG